MKRIITLLLAVSVLFTFAACTKTENTDPTADASNTGVPNPMTEITAEEMEFDVNVPEGAEDVKYFVIEDGDSKMDQVRIIATVCRAPLRSLPTICPAFMPTSGKTRTPR